MNILVINPYSAYDPSGNSFVYSPAKEFARRGHSVRVLFLSPYGKAANGWTGKFSFALDRQTVDGVVFFRLRYLSLSHFGEKTGWNEFALHQAFRRHIAEVLDGFRPDIIYAHTLDTSALVRWLKSYTNCPAVITTHGTDLTAPFLAGAYQSICAHTQAADAVVAVSSALQKKLITAGVEVPTSVILNGVQMCEIDHSAVKKPFSMIQVSDLRAQKKADITLRAFAKLRKRYPEMSLKIIGSGEEESSLKALAQELALSDSLQFLGRQPNSSVLMEMSRTQFFCMPSVREGFGVVYIEAMAAGCVTIGTQGEGIADLIQDGQNGFLVPPDDPDAIVAVIESCLKDPEGIRAITAQAAADTKSLTWANNATQYLNLFEQLIEKSVDL